MICYLRSLALSFLGAILITAPVLSQEVSNQPTPPAAGVPITVTVTVLGRNYKPVPDIPKDDVTVYSDKTRLDVTRWGHAQAGKADLQFAILIDDNVRTSLIGNQLNDLAKFINLLPANASVGVFYAQNGSAYAAAPFGTDHTKAAKSLHLTLGRMGDSPSIYLSLADLASHWPSQKAARREVLLIGSGNDELDPGSQDPYFDSAVEAVQKAGVNVHAIYVGSTRYGLSFRGDISQGKLVQVSSNTGGQSFVDLPSAPVSFAPFMNDLQKVLSNQYVLTFVMPQSNKKNGELRPIEIRFEERSLKISAPKMVFAPAR